MRCCRGVRSVVAFRASAVSRLAWLAAPTSRASWCPSPPTQKLPDRRSSPGFLSSGSDSPGQQGLVDVDPPAVEHRTVDDELVAGADVDDVPADDLLRGDLDVPAVADHGHPAPAEQLEPVELALGPDLLHGADGRVDQAEADAGEGVAVAAEREQGGADDEQDDVEEREDVRAQDPGVAAGRCADGDVALTAPAPGLGLRLGQPRRNIDRSDALLRVGRLRVHTARFPSPAGVRTSSLDLPESARQVGTVLAGGRYSQRTHSRRCRRPGTSIPASRERSGPEATVGS